MTSANPQRGQLGFEVGGENWVFAFTTNALCVVEEEFDLKDISQLETVLSDSPSLRTIRKLFRIGLTDCHPEMSDLEAGQIMEAVGGLEPSLELIMRAVETAFPEAARGGTGSPPKRAPKAKGARGTGRTSTSRGAKQA
ncbi:hypothetical protein [Novosphingobium sp. BW1]|uniref:hypothetical protein n=1 Tax=Novosphingobium sp. BW1 TaxID=2592621 RepID=UPI0011DE5D9F|nr:hypothetical protein [Novosphingobium sp. BW1]TYC93048.1 hypothetical protein FMM79_03410 [Novosphingobium sp. BW1]